jgi:hypothetical protein
MGIELEVIPDDLPTATDQVNSIVREQSKWALLKEEGSVSEGFEICTVPMLIDKHYRIWKEDFENQKFDLHQHGKNCGMHIHLNRASVTKIGLGRLVFLIYGQQSNIRFTKLIAERSPGIYWGTDPKEISQIMRYPFYSDKFEALNLQHRDSLEFRMFRSDTSSNAIFKGLEYVAACREFCNNEIFIRPYWYNFVEWVFKNKTTYPHLTAFLEEKKEEGYFDESSMRIMAEQDYLNTLFKKATKDVAYYEEDNDGSRIWCSVDGDNWWKETKEGIFPICGEVPSNFHSMKKLPIEDLIS